MKYPEVGSIQVSKDGLAIVYVWPLEYGDDDKDCFNGVELITGEVSGLWERNHFEYNNIFKKSLIKKYKKLRKQLTS